MMTHPSPLSLILLLCLPASVHALPRSVEFRATPYLGLNTRLVVQASFAVRPKWITIHLQRLEAGRPPAEVHVYAMKGSQPPRGSRAGNIVFLDDRNPSPTEVEVETVDFFPLGGYRVVVRDQEGASTSVVRDTRAFPLLLRRNEQSQEDKSWLESLQALSFGQDKGRLLRGRTDIAIEAKAPRGTVRAAGLQFSWTVPQARPREFWLYVLDDERVVWPTRSRGNQVRYRGPALKPGKTYYWILGGRSESHLLTFERLQAFSVRSP